VRSVSSNPIRPDGSVEWVVLDLLLEHSHSSWLVGELVDEIGSPIAVAEALEALQVAGLIERKDTSVRIAPM
jgi:DNA-binding transcriptional ArsR family regulator